MLSIAKLGRLPVSVLLMSSFALTSCQSASAPAAPTPALSAVSATQAPQSAPTKPTPVAAAVQPAAPAPATTQPAPEIIKVGIEAALTGPANRNGIVDERFIRFGIDDINAKGIRVGGKAYRLEAVTADDRGTTEGGREAANRLVLAEKVKIILGAISTPLAAAQAITEPNKVLNVSFTAVDKSLGTGNPYTVMTYSHPIMRQSALYDWLHQEHPEVKRIALLYMDDPTGRGLFDYGVAKAKEQGLTITSQDFYLPDIKDFSPLLTRVLQQNPDAIDLGIAGSRPPVFLALVKGLAEQKFKGQTIAVSVDLTSLREASSFLGSFGLTAAQLTDITSDAVGAAEKGIVKRYVDKYGESSLETAPLTTYNAAPLLAQAMEKAGTVDDTTRLAQTLREGQWDTIYGQRKFVGVKTFKLPVILEQPIYLMKLQDGKPVTFKAMLGTLP